MNKTELITAMAEASGLTKKDCDTALNAVSYTHLDVYKRQEMRSPAARFLVK